MQVADTCSYELDAELRLIGVDQGWIEFAMLNGAPAMLPPGPIGTSVLEFISDPTTRSLYVELFADAVSHWRPVSFPIRCDSPALRRRLELTITPLPSAGFRIDSVLLEASPNPGGELLVDARPRNLSAVLRICSWCRKMQVNHEWHELDEAARRLRLFERPDLPLLTHGMCNDCYSGIRALLDQERRSG